MLVFKGLRFGVQGLGLRIRARDGVKSLRSITSHKPASLLVWEALCWRIFLRKETTATSCCIGYDIFFYQSHVCGNIA